MTGAPTRPTIPPVAWFAVAMWWGAVLAESVTWGRGGGQGSAAVLLCVAAAGLAVLGFVWGRRASAKRGPNGSGNDAERARVRHRMRAVTATVCVGCAAGLCVSALQGWAWLRQRAVAEDCGAREWVGTVEADPLPGAYGTVARVRIRGGPLDGARVRVGWPKAEDPPELGRVVRFSAILKPLPEGEPWARRTARSGVCATGTAWCATTGGWRRDLSGPLFAWRSGMLERMHMVSGPGGDLAEGIVLGDRRRLIGTPTEEDFRILGLTHLVAVSGSHLAAACAAVAVLGSAIRLPKRALVVATVAAGAAYAVVTGLPYSALRSLLMLVVGGAGQIAGRRGDGVSSLAVAVIGVIAVDPWAVFDLGFQLSALAVGGLLLFGSLASTWVTVGVRGPARLVGGTLALTLVAQLTTVPVVAAGFGMVSLLAPVANALVGPLVSVAMLVGLSGAVVGGILPGAAVVASKCAAAILGATAWIAGKLALTPGAAIAMNGGPMLGLGTAAGAAALWAWWPLPRAPSAGYRLMALTAVASVALALGPAPARQASVTVLDVGQGDAILVRDGGRTMLVDTGAEPLALRRALARTGIRSIDVMVLTHAHEDHTGGVSGLCGVSEVGWVGIPGENREEEVETEASRIRDLMPGDAEWRGPDTPVREVIAGDRWRVGGTDVEVLWPPADPPRDLSTNDTSVVLLVSRGAFDIVLTGDAEKAAQDGMLAAGKLREVEVLKVPHHGSANGLTAEGLAAWSPRDAIISVGAGNDFGHPSPETIDLLRTSGARILRTDNVGDLVVTVHARGYRIRASRRGSGLEVRARMGRIRALAPSVTAGNRTFAERRLCGRKGDRRTQDGLSDLRRRGVAARSRPPPPQGSHRQGRRP